MFKKFKVKKEISLVLFIFLFGFLVRLWSVLPANTIIGYDQARDLWNATTIFRDFDIHIVGPTAGNNPNLHHGVAFWYYMVIPLIVFSGNPIGVVIWNSIFNAGVVIVLYFLGRDLFKSRKVGVIAAIVGSCSYLIVEFSGWLSNPTVTVFTVPVFFYGLWKFYERKKWGLPLAFLFLGLSIEFELFFIYLIPVGILLFILLKMKLPDLKTFLLSIFLFGLTTSSMIATEFKFNFAGVKSILGAGSLVGAGKSPFFSLIVDYLKRFDSFYLNFSPGFPLLGSVVGVGIIVLVVYEIIRNLRNKNLRDRFVFVFVYIFSPMTMLVLGAHNAPWFLVGRPASVILGLAYLLSKIKSKFLLICVIAFIVVANLLAIKGDLGKGQKLLEPDSSAIMSDQLKAIDYTYQGSDGQGFSVNSLTNPLYINALWAYHYYWYGRGTYGYLPTWAGGDQLYPYDSLVKPDGREKYLYLLIDTTFRIPPQYRNEIINWANKKSSLVEEKTFGGIEVQKRVVEENLN